MIILLAVEVRASCPIRRIVNPGTRPQVVNKQLDPGIRILIGIRMPEAG